MLDISVNVHAHAALTFAGMNHEGNCKSVVIGSDGYPDVTFFLRREHAVQIRDHFTALVAAWPEPAPDDLMIGDIEDREEA